MATISYNSMAFLVSKLESLVKNEIISFYALIEHKPEEDENKAHCHVYIEPAKACDTIWLRKQFNEVDPANPGKPLGVLPIGSSKFVDWYWYGLHDRAYLASKNQSRKYHYNDDQVLTSDTEYLAEKVRQNPNPKAELLKVMELIMQGYKPLQIAVQMNVKTRNLGYFLNGLESMRQHLQDVTDRDGQLGHDGVFQLQENKDDEQG